MPWSAKVRGALALSFVAALLPATAGIAGDGVTINVTNDGTVDLVVTVYDMNAGTQAAVLSHQRINGFTTVPVSVTPDAEGKARVSWTATTVDPTSRKCGRQDSVALDDSASLLVHADSACGA